MTLAHHPCILKAELERLIVRFEVSLGWGGIMRKEKGRSLNLSRTF